MAETEQREPVQEVLTDEAGVPVESALVAEDLDLRYPTSEEAVVECARLNVPEGEVTALVGPNGSGKSTLLKALSNHLTPESGTVRLHGESIQSFDQTELAREIESRLTAAGGDGTSFEPVVGRGRTARCRITVTATG